MSTQLAAAEPAGADLLEACERLLDRVADDPVATLEDARRLGGTAAGHGDGAAGAVAGRAEGLALLYLGRVGEAIGVLERTLTTAAAAGESRRAALVRMTLAGPLTHAGRVDEALRQLDLAEPELAGVDLGRVSLQRAQVMHRSSGGGAATKVDAAFQRAVATFEEAGEVRWLGQALNSWGLHAAYAGNVDAATARLHRAAGVYRRAGLEAAEADIVNNLGFVAALAGDYVQAQKLFADAEADFRRLGMPLAELLNDRCLALLSVGLADEAKELAASAVVHRGEAGAAADATDALILHAHACLLGGDVAAAHASAARAVREYRRQGRRGWQWHARSVELRCRAELGHRTRRDLDTASRLARRLAEAGLAGPALEANLLVARMATARGDTGTASIWIDRSRRLALAGPIEQRLALWLAEARNRLAQEDWTGARRAVTAGLAALDAYQSVLGATDVRAHVRGFGAELGDIGLRLALRDGRPAQVLRWMERTRAGALRTESIKPFADRRLNDLVTELRLVVADLRQAELEGEDDRNLRRRQVELQAEIRRHSRTRDVQTAAAPPLGPSRLAERLGDGVLVEMARVGAEVVAVVLQRRGRLVRLGEWAPVQQHVHRLRAALLRLATGRSSPASRAANTAVVDRSAAALDELLVAPLRIGDRRAVLVVPPELYATPWALLPSLYDRPFTVSPSASLWYRRSTRTARRAARVLLAAGPGLPAAAEEVRRLGRIYPDAVRMTPHRSSAADVTRTLDGVEIAHLACHGSFRPRNPMFSSLEFGDGPLFVHELEGLRHAPHTMVLSACDSGLSAARPGNEMLGLANTLLGLGTRTIVGSVVPVPDAALTRRLMVAFHTRLAAGAAPADALVEARNVSGSLTDRVTTGAFVCFGAG